MTEGWESWIVVELQYKHITCTTSAKADYGGEDIEHDYQNIIKQWTSKLGALNTCPHKYTYMYIACTHIHTYVCPWQMMWYDVKTHFRCNLFRRKISTSPAVSCLLSVSSNNCGWNCRFSSKRRSDCCCSTEHRCRLLKVKVFVMASYYRTASIIDRQTGNWCINFYKHIHSPLSSAECSTSIRSKINSYHTVLRFRNLVNYMISLKKMKL